MAKPGAETKLHKSVSDVLKQKLIPHLHSFVSLKLMQTKSKTLKMESPGFLVHQSS